MQLAIDLPTTILASQEIDATTESDIYYTERWTLVAFQIDLSDSSTPNYSAQVQASIDGVGWGNFGSAISITANDTYCFNTTLVGFSKLRIKLTKTAGSGTFRILAQGKQG